MTRATTHRRAEHARILEVTSYPPPRSGWAVRVEYVKRRLEQLGHSCIVVNIGASRTIPSTEYETVVSGVDLVRKVWRYSRRGYVVHAHANGDAIKGLGVALLVELLNLLAGRRCVLTFHAGAIQRYFPQHRNRWLVPAYWLLFTIPGRIICNNNQVKQRIASYGVPARKIAAIPAFSREYVEFTPVALPRDLDAFMRRYPTVVFTYICMRPLFFPTVMIDGMAAVMARHPDVGIVACGMAGHQDDGVLPAFEAAIARHGIRHRMHIVEDLEHDTFLTVLQRSAVYLRTPITDGVASSVLEALALGIPVVGSDNGSRPPSVTTYPPTDPVRLAAAVEHVLANRAGVVTAMPRTEIRDTVADEVALLTCM